MKIAHFDIDDIFAPFFQEKKYSFPLRQETVGSVPDGPRVNIVTIKSTSKLNKHTLKKLPSLKCVIARSVGVDNIDIDYCKANKIAVYHIPDYGSFAIAEHIFALILSKARKVIDVQADINMGKFIYSAGQGFTLRDKTLGIVGIGRVGKQAVGIARAFQADVIGYDIKKDLNFARRASLKYVSLTKLLTVSDVVILTVTLTKKTHHLIDHNAIKAMKDQSVLINVSRGEIIDTKALIKNIKKFRFVGLDVLEEETHFNRHSELLKHPNILITPHIAFFTDRTTTQIAAITNRNIQYFLDGKQTNRVV